MRAIQVAEHGGPEVLRIADLAPPSPGADEVLVRTEAIGVNFIDVYHRSGRYPIEPPFVPGDEASGVVLEVGADVTDIAPGDRVAWSGPTGTYAEVVAVPAAVVVAVPDGIPPAIAASTLAQGLTAHYLAHSTYRIEPGDDVLVHAGAGGVGLLLTQLAVHLGARVITTVSTDAKAELSRRAGASLVLRYEDDIAARVREFTDGAGVAVAYDGVGATTFDASLASVRPRGLVALFGAASGPVPPLDPQRLNAAGSVYLTRPTLGDYVRDRAELLWRANDVFAAVVSGELCVHVDAEFPLADAADAHRALEGRSTRGAIVLVP